MSDTDINSAKDLAPLKLTELRAMAAKKGLRGISGLRKGDLITAIISGQVPGKAAAAAEDKPAKAAPRASKAAKKESTAEAASAAPANVAEASADNTAGDNNAGDKDDKAKQSTRRPRRVVRSNSAARAEDSSRERRTRLRTPAALTKLVTTSSRRTAMETKITVMILVRRHVARAATVPAATSSKIRMILRILLIGRVPRTTMPPETSKTPAMITTMMVIRR